MWCTRPPLWFPAFLPGRMLQCREYLPMPYGLCSSVEASTQKINSIWAEDLDRRFAPRLANLIKRLRLPFESLWLMLSCVLFVSHCELVKERHATTRKRKLRHASCDPIAWLTLLCAAVQAISPLVGQRLRR